MEDSDRSDRTVVRLAPGTVVLLVVAGLGIGFTGADFLKPGAVPAADSALAARIDSVERRVDRLDVDLRVERNARIEAAATRFNRVDAGSLEKTVSARLDKLDARLDRIETRLQHAEVTVFGPG